MTALICMTALNMLLIVVFALFVKYMYLPLLKGVLQAKAPEVAATAFPVTRELSEDEKTAVEDSKRNTRLDEILISGKISEKDIAEFAEKEEAIQ